MLKLSALMGMYLLTGANDPTHQTPIAPPLPALIAETVQLASSPAQVPPAPLVKITTPISSEKITQETPLDEEIFKTEEKLTRAPRPSEFEEQNLPIYVNLTGRGPNITTITSGNIFNVGPAFLAFVGNAGSLDSSWKFVAGPFRSNLLVDTTRRTFELDDVHNARTIWKVYESRADVNGNLFECSTDNAYFLGNMRGSGGIEALGNMKAGGTLGVTGSAAFGDELVVGGATTIDGTVTINNYTTINSTLHTTGATTLDAALTVDGSTTINSSVATTDTITAGKDVVLTPVIGEVSNIKFTNNAGGEKTRISSANSATERGIYVSIDDGTTKNLHIDNSGSTIHSSSESCKLGINGQIYSNQSNWSLTAGSIGLEENLHRTLALTFDRYFPNTSIATVYDGRNDVTGNLLEINTDNVFLTGRQLCKIHSPVTVTNILGLAPVTIENNDLTITNGNLTAVNGSFLGPVGICGTTPTAYNFEVNGNSHMSGNLKIDGSIASTGSIDLGNGSSISYRGLPILQSSGLNDGYDNIFVGINTGNNYVWGTSNTAIGASSLQFVEAGSNNVAVGQGALPLIYDGSYNVAIGAQAGANYGSTESANICIGYNVLGKANENNVTRIGNGILKTFVSGIEGINIGSTGDLVGISNGGVNGDQLGTQATNWNLTGNLTTTGKASVGTDIAFSSITNPSTGITDKIFAAGTPLQTSRIMYCYCNVLLFGNQQVINILNATPIIEGFPGTRIGRTVLQWTPSFSENPTVMVTPINEKTTVSVSQISTNGCIVQCQTFSGGNFIDAISDFVLLVVGAN